MPPKKTLHTALIAVGIFLSVYVIGVCFRIVVIDPSNSKGWTQHAQRVYREFQHIFTWTLEAETNERGYIITGDRAYYDYYRQAKGHVFVHLKRAIQLTSDNSLQQQDLGILQDSLEKRFAEIDQKVLAYDTKGQHAAMLMVIRGHGKTTMDLVRTIVDRMEDREDVLLEKRDRYAEVLVYSMIVSVVLLMFRDGVWIHFFVKRD